ncbi:Transmembrane amino acid transporter [Blattamonas nauphoetae]|uniref:Transmembrane amino acid transporter n=1 Tax=Blattamonas nauphoetae TaxID=2049346 RepID=A0ABQ9YMI5_9EUKA|nr:Transmembrane amino acid transporter [Blattamonas nauphoetae]
MIDESYVRYDVHKSDTPVSNKRGLSSARIPSILSTHSITTRPNGVGLPLAFFNTVKSFIGSGLLGLPYGFLTGGWAMALISFPLVCVIETYGMMNMISCKKVLPRGSGDTFADLGLVAFGNFGYWLVQIILILFQGGCCCSYILFISQNLTILIPQIPQELWVLVCIVILMLLSFVRTLKATGVFSLTATFSLLIGVVFVVIGVVLSGGKRDDLQAFNLKSFPVFFGIVIFLFEGAGMVIPLQSSMKQPKHFSILLVVVVSMVCVIYSGFGFACYALHGKDTPEMITAVISPQYQWMRVLVLVFLIYAITMTYHLLAFPIYEAVDTLPFLKRRDKGSFSYWILSSLCRLGVILITAIPSLTPLQKHFPQLIGLIGGTCGLALAFFLPAILHIKLSWKTSGLLRRICDIGLIVIGVPSSLLVTIFTVIDLVHHIKS